HDAVGHHLTALSLNLEALALQVDGKAAEPVREARALAKRALEDVRGVVDRLREPERTDLFAALRALAEKIPRPRIHLSLPGEVATRGPARALTVLRCAQEIVSNAVRHASAENLWIELREVEGALEIHARDDGRGAEAIVLGHGLTIMRERLESGGGRLEI